MLSWFGFEIDTLTRKPAFRTSLRGKAVGVKRQVSSGDVNCGSLALEVIILLKMTHETVMVESSVQKSTSELQNIRLLNNKLTPNIKFVKTCPTTIG